MGKTEELSTFMEGFRLYCLAEGKRSTAICLTENPTQQLTKGGKPCPKLSATGQGSKPVSVV